MKAVGILVLFLSLVVCNIGNIFTTPGNMHNGDDDMPRIVKIRKLNVIVSASTLHLVHETKRKENSEENKGQNIELEDYRPLDPVPTSKTSVRPGPIQHGTPLMPYIPKPAPPTSQPVLSPSP